MGDYEFFFQITKPFLHLSGVEPSDFGRYSLSIENYILSNRKPPAIRNLIVGVDYTLPSVENR